jgi:hypothetical protein
LEQENGSSQTYTAVIKPSDAWWIGWIEEIPGVNCQERTRAELLEWLKVTPREALGLNRREVLEAAGESFEEAPIALWGAPLLRPAGEGYCPQWHDGVRWAETPPSGKRELLCAVLRAVSSLPPPESPSHPVGVR